jgi:hypothetical protein
VDPPRLLGKVLGYTTNPAEALPREPEAVDEETLAGYSNAARRRDQERLRAAWKRAHAKIDSSLADFKRDAQPDRGLLSDVRVIERQAERVGRRLGL